MTLVRDSVSAALRFAPCTRGRVPSTRFDQLHRLRRTVVLTPVAAQSSAGLVHVVGRFEEGAQRLLEFLVAVEAFRDLVVNEDGALRPSPQAASVGLDRELEPLRAQLGDLEVIVLDAGHIDVLHER